MTTFVDTSAFFALLDAADSNHGRAIEWLSGPGGHADEPLVTHAYVVVECSALVHRRIGHDGVRELFDAFVPSVRVQYVDEDLHRLALAAYLARGSRRSSLVDSVSFEMMRNEQIDDAFAFDRDFANEGFELVPG